MVRLLVISDTHLAPDTLDRVPDAVWDAADAVDGIWHAGDVVCRELLEVLGERAPVSAVRGNHDEATVPELPHHIATKLAAGKIFTSIIPVD